MNKTYSWQGGTSTAFGVAANWFDLTDGVTAASPPGAGDAIELIGSGTILGTATGLTSLTVSDTSDSGYALGVALGVSSIAVDGRLELIHGASVTTGTLGVDGGMLVLQDGTVLQAEGQGPIVSVLDSGSVAVEGGTLDASSMSGLAVQVSDGGTLAVSAGALNTTGEFLIGETPDDNAIPGGTFTASSAAVITSNSATGNAVVIGGSGSPDVAALVDARWTVNGGMSLTMGADVSLSAGAALSVSGTLHLGEHQTVGDTNILSVSDSTLTATTLVVGLGTLLLSNGSTLVAGGAAGGLAFAAGVIHGDYDSPANVLIDGSHALVEGQGEVGGTLTVADGGTLSITNGGTDSLGAALYVDGGTLNVTGSHSVMRLGGGLDETGLTAVADKVIISAGAQVSIAGGFGLREGVATIDGASTAVHVTGQVGVAFGGGTTLTISGGAELNVSLADGQTLPGMEIASADEGQNCLVAVTSGSHLSVATALVVAVQDRGELAISSGGTVAAGSVAVGGPNATQGSLSLAGSGDVLTTQLLTIGTTGTVTLGTGSHLSAGGLLVGTAGQGVATAGAATIDISGGTLSVFGGASVHGGVVLSQGGTLTVSNGLTLAAGSTIIGQGVLGAGNIVDLGRIGTNGGTMTCLGPVNGSGLLSVAAGDIVLAHGEASTVGLVFGVFGTFTTTGVGLISGTITGWSTGDAFDFTRVHIASDSLSGHVLTLFDGAGTVLGREIFAGNFASSNFSLSSDHGTGTMLSFHA